MVDGWFRTSDGIRLKYQIRGNGPAIIIANGLGGSFPAWKFIVESFEDRFTFYSWDYRGLFESEKPADISSITVSTQTQDLIELMDFWNIETAIFAGWSYGGQVLVDLYSKKPEVFNGIVFLNAMVGSASDSQSIPSVLLPLYDRFLSLWSLGWKFLKPFAGRAVSSGVFLTFVKNTGLVASELNEEIFEEMALKFILLDHEIFQATLLSAQNFTGIQILETINVPCMVIAGTRDFVVLPSSSRIIASKIPQCQLRLIKNTSHYSAVERPSEVIACFNEYLISLNQVKGYNENITHQ